MFRVPVVKGECMLTLSLHDGHPHPPKGGLMIDPAGCRPTDIWVIEIGSSHVRDERRCWMMVMKRVMLY
eukprot:7325906-Pyramimonas_sp.AAC.1